MPLRRARRPARRAGKSRTSSRTRRPGGDIGQRSTPISRSGISSLRAWRPMAAGATCPSRECPYSTGRGDFAIECRLVLPEGTLKHVQTIGHPVFDAAGRVVEWLDTLVNVTQRKGAIEATREIEGGRRQVWVASHLGRQVDHRGARRANHDDGEFASRRDLWSFGCPLRPTARSFHRCSA